MFGWRWTGGFPNVPRLVLIGAPHTSNWDGIIGLAAAAVCGIDVRVMGKAELFRFPFRRLLRWVGIIPVQRDAPGGLVEQATARLSSPEPFALGLAPEGTRARVERWKTGFYRIAVAADVPIAVIGLDWGRRRIGVNGTLLPSGDLQSDLDAIAQILKDVTGKHPELDSPIHLDASSSLPA